MSLKVFPQYNVTRSKDNEGRTEFRFQNEKGERVCVSKDSAGDLRISVRSESRAAEFNKSFIKKFRELSRKVAESFLKRAAESKGRKE